MWSGRRGALGLGFAMLPSFFIWWACRVDKGEIYSGAPDGKVRWPLRQRLKEGHGNCSVSLQKLTQAWVSQEVSIWSKPRQIRSLATPCSDFSPEGQGTPRGQGTQPWRLEEVEDTLSQTLDLFHHREDVKRSFFPFTWEGSLGGEARLKDQAFLSWWVILWGNVFCKDFMDSSEMKGTQWFHWFSSFYQWGHWPFGHSSNFQCHRSHEDRIQAP